MTTRRAAIAVLSLIAAVGCSTPGRAPVLQSDAFRDSTIHSYRRVGDATLRAFVFAPARTSGDRRRPAILLFHGGGWGAGSPEWVFSAARRFATLGFVAIPIQYRLSSGSMSPIDALVDVCGALEWARREATTLGLDPRRVAAYGVSAGGHLAALAATVGCGNGEGAFATGGPDALVLWSPALDLARDRHFQRLLGERAAATAYSPVEHVRPRMPPVTIVHGEKDSLTPLSGARRFCDRVVEGGGRCELHQYPGVGHLLTRNLANQEDNFDPDPVAREDGIAKQLQFLRTLWR